MPAGKESLFLSAGYLLSYLSTIKPVSYSLRHEIPIQIKLQKNSDSDFWVGVLKFRLKFLRSPPLLSFCLPDVIPYFKSVHEVMSNSNTYRVPRKRFQIKLSEHLQSDPHQRLRDDWDRKPYHRALCQEA